VVAAPANSTTPSADGTAAILAELNSLKAKLDKDYVPVAKLPEYRSEMLASAIKAADDYASVRENHRAEFNEPLDRGAFEKYVADNAAANVKFPSMSAAHDSFVREKRTTKAAADEKTRTDAAVAEALKQQKSSASVPGQTQQVAASPMQQVMQKARTTNSGAESAALVAARKLEDLDRNRATVQ
jgi:hypothetical protein